MVLMDIAAAISGAASALNTYVGLNYDVGIFVVGIIARLLTIFGTSLVRKASPYMGIGTVMSAGFRCVTLPTLVACGTPMTSCIAMGTTWLTVVYSVCLLLCLISTGVTITFAFVSRFENASVHNKIAYIPTRNAVSSVFIISLSMIISTVGLGHIIKYGCCGYLGIFAIVIHFLTVGAYKNHQYMRENGEEFETC